MPRHDFRDPVTGKFGKRVVAYPHASEAFPAVTERGTKRKTTKPPAYGSTHEDYPGSPGLVLTEQSALLGDDLSEVKTYGYETLPGPALPTVTVSRDAEGGTQVTTSQDVLLANTPPPAEPLVFGTNSISLQATDCIKGVLTTVTADHPPRSGQIVNDATLGSVGTVTLQTLPAGTPALAPALNLISSEGQPLDAAHTLRTDTLVVEWPTLTTLENTRIGRQITLIPAKFVGGDTLTETREKVSPATPPDPISQTVLSSIVTQETLARSEKVNVTRPNNAYPALTGGEMSVEAGGVAAVTSDEVVPAGTPPATGFLVLSSASEPIDKFYNELTTKQVAAFPTLEGKESSANIPEKFLAAFTLNTVDSWVDTTGGVPDPDGGPLVLDSRIVPETEFRGKKTTRNLPVGATLPTLTGSEMANEAGGVAVSVVEQVVAPGTVAATGFGVLSSEVQTLSSGTSLETTKRVTVFPTLEGASFDVSVPDKFLQGFDIEEDQDWVDTTTTLATAQLTTGVGVLSCKITPETAARGKRVTRRLPAGAVLPTFTSKRRNGKGQYVTTVESIDDGTAALPTLSATTVGPTSLEPLGGGNFLRTISTVGDVFAEEEYTAELPNPIPERFRALDQTVTTGVTSAGTAYQPTLVTGELRVSVRQVDEQTIRTETTTLNLSALPTLTSTKRNERGQYVTTAESIDDGTAALPTITDLIVEPTSLEPLGNGYFLRTISTISALFTEESYSVEVPNPVPEKFRALAKTTTNTFRQAGTATTPTLGTGEFRRSQAQEDEQTVRIEVTSIDLTSLPATLDGSEMIEGLEATVTETLASGSQSYTNTAYTLSAEVTSIGAGLTILTQRTVTSFPVLHGQRFNEQLGVADPYTLQKMSHADAALVAGNPNTEITPVDALRAEVRVSTPPTTLATYLKGYAVTTPLNLPDVLVDVVIVTDTSEDAGIGIETGAAAANPSGTLALNITNSGEGGSSVLPEVAPLIQGFPREGRPAMDWVFLVEDNTTNVLAALSTLLGKTVNVWPDWHPTSHTIACFGQKLSVRATASARISENSNAAAESSGYSKNYNRSSSVRTSTIKPTIHGPLGVSGNVTSQATASASASANVGGIATSSATISLKANSFVSPYQFAATPGMSTIPATGLYAERYNSEAYKDGYTMVRVRVVDFSLLGIAMATGDTHTTPLEFTIDEGSQVQSFLAAANTTPPTDTSDVAPTISAPPVTTAATPGSPVTLSAGATGTYPLTYQWEKDGVAIAGATNPSYTIPAFNPATQAGNYSVTVTNTTGSASSTPVAVSSSTILAITMQPVSQNAQVGQTVTFSVAAANASTYQWQYNGLAIDGATSPSYTIYNATSDNAGSYTVVISNGTTSITSVAATLQIVSLTIITQLPALTADPNHMLILSATGQGNVVNPTDSLSVTWYRFGIALPTGPDPINGGVSLTNTNVNSVVNGNNVSTVSSQYILGGSDTTLLLQDFAHKVLDPVGEGATVPYYAKFTDGFGNSLNTNTVIASPADEGDNPIITSQPASLAVIVNGRGVYSPAAGGLVAEYNATFAIAVTHDNTDFPTAVVYRWLNNAQFLKLTDNPTSFSSTFIYPVTNAIAAPLSLEVRVNTNYGYVQSSTALLQPFYLEFATPSVNPASYNTVSVSSGATVPVQMNYYYLGSGTGGEVFSIALTQICSDGTAAHGTFSTASFTSTTVVDATHSLTGVSNYTPSATDAGKDVQIIATLAFSAGAVTGTIGSVSTIVHVTT